MIMTVALIYFYALPINFKRFFCKCLQLEILTERPIYFHFEFFAPSPLRIGQRSPCK